MSYRVTVVYGHPQDPAAFDSYFRANHLELAKKIPNVRHITAGRTESPNGTKPEGYFISQYLFDSREDAAFAFASAEAQAATEDLANFASGGATLFMTDDEVNMDVSGS